MGRNILIIAYHFPPYGGGSVIRVFNFCKYLPQYGYTPHVLTVSEDFYDDAYHSPEMLEALSGTTHLHRSGSLEPKAKKFRNKVFGLKKKSIMDRILIACAKAVLGRTLIPDRTVLWYPPAVAKGDEIIKAHGIEAILSTAPSFTAHLVGRRLAKKHGIPLYLDYRDDWVGNPAFMKHGGLTAWLNRRMEAMVTRTSRHIFCATEFSRNFLLRKYSFLDAGKVSTLTNGFDPEVFKYDPAAARENDGTLRIVYVGSLTPDRSPESLFLALVKLREEKPKSHGRVRVVFYGYCPLFIKEKSISLGLTDTVEFHDGIPSRTVGDMLNRECDMALTIQSAKVGGETAIPGKIYEYMALRKPIFNISERGAVWEFLEGIGSSYNAHYSDPNAICAMLSLAIEQHRTGILIQSLPPEQASKFDRRVLTGKLAGVIEATLVRSHAPGHP